jgi:hypothetical protein
VFAGSEQSLVSRLGGLLFWCALADILWRAANNQFSSTKKENLVTGLPRNPARPNKKLVSFEDVVILRSTPLRFVNHPAGVAVENNF